MSTSISAFFEEDLSKVSREIFLKSFNRGVNVDEDDEKAFLAIRIFAAMLLQVLQTLQ